MMKCSECRENISVYIDGELPEAEQHDISQHVRDCPDCAAVLDRMRRAVQALSGMPEEAPPPDFMARLNERLDAEDLRRSRKPWFFLSRWFLLPGAATVAVACLAIVLVSRYLEMPQPVAGPQKEPPRISQQQDKLAAGGAKAAPEMQSASAVRPEAVAAAEARKSELQERPAPAAAKDTANAMKKKGAAEPAAGQWQGSTSGITEAMAVAIYDDAAWARLWGRHAPGTSVPKIDFSRFMALAVFQGSESSGRCCMRITGIIHEAKKIRVFYSLDEPAVEKAGGPFSSFQIKVIKRAAAPVVFTKRGG